MLIQNYYYYFYVYKNVDKETLQIKLVKDIKIFLKKKMKKT